MSQCKFICELLEEFEGHGVLPRRTLIKVDYDGYGSGNCPKEDAFYETPEDTSSKLNSTMKTKYESGVGSINWAANNSRPDLAQAANSLATRAANSTQPRTISLDSYTASDTSAKASSKSIEQKLDYNRERMVQEGTSSIETFSDAS